MGNPGRSCQNWQTRGLGGGALAAMSSTGFVGKDQSARAAVAVLANLSSSGEADSWTSTTTAGRCRGALPSQPVPPAAGGHGNREAQRDFGSCGSSSVLLTPQ